MKFGVNVKGLTTATSLWTTAIIGIACGGRYYYAALLATCFVLLALVFVHKIGSVFLTGYRTREFKIRLADRPGVIDTLRTRLESRKVKIISMNAAMPDKETLKLDMIIRVPGDLKMDALINLVNDIGDTKSMQID